LGKEGVIELILMESKKLCAAKHSFVTLLGSLSTDDSLEFVSYVDQELSARFGEPPRSNIKTEPKKKKAKTKESNDPKEKKNKKEQS